MSKRKFKVCDAICQFETVMYNILVILLRQSSYLLKVPCIKYYTILAHKWSACKAVIIIFCHLMVLFTKKNQMNQRIFSICDF